MGGLGDFAGNFISGGGTGGYQSMQQQIQKAIDSLNQQYSSGRGQLQPWADQGLNAFNQYGQAINGMSDPSQYYAKIMSGYQQSPAAQFQMQQAQRASNSAAAAGGGLGSGAQQKEMAAYAQGLTSQDMQNYFGNVMGVNNQYMQGLGNMYGTGFNAAGQINNSYMNQGNAMADQYNNMGMAKYGENTALYGGINNWLNQGAGMAMGFM